MWKVIVLFKSKNKVIECGVMRQTHCVHTRYFISLSYSFTQFWQLVSLAAEFSFFS